MARHLTLSAANVRSRDTLTPAQRSERMSRVRNKDTVPEMLVRRLVHRLGYRYRLHGRGLPGHPDLVFGPRRKVIFIHGCFWHRHDERTCPLTRTPKSRLEFWTTKFQQNAARDRKSLAALHATGWAALVIWECETKDTDALSARITAFLGTPR